MERTKETLKELIRAGRAKVPAHKVIKGGQLVNVMSSEIYPADVAVYNDMIVAVGDVEDYIGSETEIIDATGYYLTPGMIDGHIHSECSKMSITSYAKAVVPRGTTSMISGLDEYISVSGLEGLQEVLAEMKQSPLKVFWGAPYKTPYTIPKSTVAFNFTEEVHKEVQKWPECYGVWETVREFLQEEDEDTLGAIVETSKNRLPVFGCAPMAVGNDLNGYLCGGVRLDHESYTHEEVVEKMRKGMHMLIRESCVTHFLEENIKAVTEVNPAFARRVVTIPYPVSIPKEQQDPYILEKLLAEKDTIATEAFRSYLALRENNYEFPNCTAYTMQSSLFVPLNSAYNAIQVFSCTNCDFSDPDAFTSTFDLYTAFCTVYGSVFQDITSFSQEFYRVNVEKLEKTRKRIGGQNNRGFYGVKLHA